MPTMVKYTTQYIAGDRDITPDLFAVDDAEVIRYWVDDYCLIELTRVDGGWQPTGSDVARWLDYADEIFTDPYHALTATAAG